MRRLIEDLEQHLPLIKERPIHSIFIGGGTPSLISPEAYRCLFTELRARLNCPDALEITLEANPGTAEQDYFQGYRELGINRLSLGIQSLQNEKLKILGRIHNADQAIQAVQTARKVGFDNINLDLMYGLPFQSVEEALSDLNNALALAPEHLSWYHLTLEPNTLFHKFPPKLPEDELLWEMQKQGQALLEQHHFKHYEISAYARENRFCAHNLNYWTFGDYLGIGAGAHGKLTDINTGEIYRSVKLKNPKEYLDRSKSTLASLLPITEKELPLEFMMNVLRLQSAISLALWNERTGLPISAIKAPLERAEENGFLELKHNVLYLTQQGHLFLNELLELFMSEY